MKRLTAACLYIVSICLFATALSVPACATGAAFKKLPRAEQAKRIIIAFQQSWDEACTQEWLRCDITAYADTGAGAYIDTVNAHPEQWQSAADVFIDSVKERAQVANQLGRWVAWLDLARAAIDTISLPST